MSNPTILLVEDNEDDVFLMKRVLKRGCITNPLQVVSDGQQALDYFAGVGEYADRERFPLPSLVFLDLKLPYVDGFEVLSWLRQQPPLASIIVFVLTSSAELRDHQKAYSLGAKSYLTKPPTVEILQEVLRSLESNANLATF
jgi:CheY-like chemotaxis protein